MSSQREGGRQRQRQRETERWPGHRERPRGGIMKSAQSLEVKQSQVAAGHSRGYSYSYS